MINFKIICSCGEKMDGLILPYAVKDAVHCNCGIVWNITPYEVSMEALNQVITVHEAASILNVTPRQVQRLCKAGKLECRYADGIWLVLKSSVEGQLDPDRVALENIFKASLRY